MLKTFNIILWDFDGVLINSDEVRTAGFERVLEKFPKDKVDKLICYHKSNGGLSRYVKFRYFFENILRLPVTDEVINQYSQAFSVIMKDLLVNPQLLITETLEFVKNRHSSGTKMHIVSGSDQIELQYLCKALEIDNYFSSIHGSPMHKNLLIKNLIVSNNYELKDLVLIGDSINDYEAAKNNNINFMGYNNISLRGLGGYIDSFVGV